MIVYYQDNVATFTGAVATFWVAQNLLSPGISITSAGSVVCEGLTDPEATAIAISLSDPESAAKAMTVTDPESAAKQIC